LNTVIEVKDLTKTFANKAAVDRVSFSVKGQSIFGLIGPDGAGKTTLFRIICGLLRADSGQVLLNGGDANRLRKEQMGYMPQRFSLYGDLTVMENINFFGSLYSLDSNLIVQRADEILNITGLIPFKNRFAHQLSGGMKQKLSLSCALLTRPQILILDEPTYGVDPASRQEFWKILYQLNHEGMTVLLSTPYMDEAELCHQLAFINQGRLLAVDSPDNLKKRLEHQVLEVRSKIKDPYLFNGLPGVLYSSFYGYKHRLIVEDLESSRMVITQKFEPQSGASFSLMEVEASMEDLFVYLTETALGKQGAS
jgi:ABC-2 type transport system ATP-binding protein